MISIGRTLLGRGLGLDYNCVNGCIFTCSLSLG